VERSQNSKQITPTNHVLSSCKRADYRKYQDRFKPQARIYYVASSLTLNGVCRASMTKDSPLEFHTELDPTLEVQPQFTAPTHPLWMKLEAYVVGPQDASLSFVARLARENGWEVVHAQRVIFEYKRFCFLALVAGHVVTPSDAVDQAWHLHLTYTSDYWERFCPTVLGQPLHHGPTEGGERALHRHFEQYVQTLKSYEHVFGESAPADLWPGAARRLLADARARRVHPGDVVILSKATIWSTLVLILAMLTLSLIYLVRW